MEENKPLLSIIIVTYNDAPYLKRCVASIYEKFKGFDAWEIVLVNNDKNQEVKSFDLDFSRIHLIDHKVNIGFGRGHNIGVKYSQGKYLLFINPDTEILDGPPLEIISEFENDKQLGIVGAGLTTQQGLPQTWSAGKDFSFFELLKNNFGIFGSRKIWEAKEKCEAAWVSGAAFFIRRSLFEGLGGFDEKIFMYLEDVDLCERARKRGQKVMFFPGYKILHKCGGSHSGRDKENQKKNYYDSLVYYFQKNRSRVEYMIVKVLRKLFFT